MPHRSHHPTSHSPLPTPRPHHRRRPPTHLQRKSHIFSSGANVLGVRLVVTAEHLHQSFARLLVLKFTLAEDFDLDLIPPENARSCHEAPAGPASKMGMCAFTSFIFVIVVRCLTRCACISSFFKRQEELVAPLLPLLLQQKVDEFSLK